MTRRGRWPLLLAALAAAAYLPGFALAQNCPTKPIRFIVPCLRGGGTDVVARILNEPLAAELHQPIIIDNRGGAARNVSTNLAAKAPAEFDKIIRDELQKWEYVIHAARVKPD